jgi:hypothetical protein
VEVEPGAARREMPSGLGGSDGAGAAEGMGTGRRRAWGRGGRDGGPEDGEGGPRLGAAEMGCGGRRGRRPAGDEGRGRGDEDVRFGGGGRRRVPACTECCYCSVIKCL